LQLLYPCSKYSTDRCIICGGRFRDHLELWWSKHLYSPFDRMVDDAHQQGLVLQIITIMSLLLGHQQPEKAIPITEQNVVERHPQQPKREKTAKTRKSSPPADSSTVTSTHPRFVYHRRYVLDLEDNAREQPPLNPLSRLFFQNNKTTNNRVETRSVLVAFPATTTLSSVPTTTTPNNYNKPNTQSSSSSSPSYVMYAVPVAESITTTTNSRSNRRNKGGRTLQQGNDNDDNSKAASPSPPFRFVRAIVLKAVDSLIQLEDLDNKRHQPKY
jgi:hypothetical protein